VISAAAPAPASNVLSHRLVPPNDDGVSYRQAAVAAGRILVMCLAIPAQIVEFVDSERFLAKVDVSGVRRVVNVALVSGGTDGVAVGDWVLLHVGFAMSRIDEHEAQATLDALRSLGAVYEQELEDLRSSEVT
jgi:hydrogenase expression/formation protein HypC